MLNYTLIKAEKVNQSDCFLSSCLTVVSIFGTTTANIIELTSASDATTRNGKLKPPTPYKSEPKAGPTQNVPKIYYCLV